MMESSEAKARLTGGSYFGTLEEARREARERRHHSVDDGLLIRVEPSPYGGFVVRSLPVDLVIEEQLGFGLTPSRSLYGDK